MPVIQFNESTMMKKLEKMQNEKKATLEKLELLVNDIFKQKLRIVANKNDPIVLYIELKDFIGEKIIWSVFLNLIEKWNDTNVANEVYHNVLSNKSRNLLRRLKFDVAAIDFTQQNREPYLFFKTIISREKLLNRFETYEDMYKALSTREDLEQDYRLKDPPVYYSQVRDEEPEI